MDRAVSVVFVRCVCAFVLWVCLLVCLLVCLFACLCFLFVWLAVCSCCVRVLRVVGFNVCFEIAETVYDRTHQSSSPSRLEAVIPSLQEARIHSRSEVCSFS